MRRPILPRIGAKREGTLPGITYSLSLLGAIAALVAAGLWRGAAVPLLGFALAAVVLGLSIWLVAGVLSALRRIHDALLIRPGSRWQIVTGGHWWRVLLALPVALASGASIALSLAAEPGRTLAMAAVALAVGWPVARMVQARASREIVAGQELRIALPLGLGAGGLAALVAGVLLRAAPAATLAEGVSGALHYIGSSVLLGQMFDLRALGAGLTDLIAQGPVGMLVALVLDASVSFGLATALMLPLIAPSMLARVLSPLGPLRPATAGLAAFAAVVLAVVGVQTLAALEGQAQVLVGAAPAGTTAPTADAGPALAGADTAPGRALPVPLPSDLRRAVERERIGDVLCPPGTIAALDGFQSRLTDVFAGQEDRLRSAIDAGFDGMRANVPAFLDWYYSLSAEYLRAATLLIGSGEEYLSGQLHSYLDTGAPFAAADAEIAAAMALAQDAAASIERSRAEIMAQCGAVLPAEDAELIIIASRDSGIVTLPVLADHLTFPERAAIAGFSGMAAGIGVAVLAKVGAKFALSSVFKAAAAALAKIAGSKALSFLGGMGLGAVAGGAGGSVVPGAGTTVGAVVGGLVGGAAVMVGVDFTLIKLEEAVSRDGFQTEILAAIDQTEAELLTALGLAD